MQEFVNDGTIDGNLDDCGATIIDKTAMIFQAMKTFEITYIEGDVINKKMTVKSDTISKALITLTLLCGVDATDITGIVEVD